VNGIRSAISKGLLSWLPTVNPDIICFQEIKAQPGQLQEEQFASLGYHSYIHSAEKKGYSGVAIFSKQEPLHVEFGMNHLRYDVEGRVIRADFSDFTVIDVYFPSGTTGELRQAVKMDFLVDFHAYLNEVRKERPNLIISGDYNICRLWIDIHNPSQQQGTSGFLPEERAWFEKFVMDGYTDSFRLINPDAHHYTWWSYRAGARTNNKGWRIDYHMVTREMESKVLDARILPDAIHSDHCPVLVDIDF
jgi:exodeoxyribonuclease-3